MSIRHIAAFGLIMGALAGCEPQPADPSGLGAPPGATPGAEDEAQREPGIAPDNTARNAQDRRAGAKTPFDQSESGSDIATTASIRREILKAENLSTNADNIKIITTNGVVTLRGVVASEAEREQVRSIATRVAGSANKVDDQLEVDAEAAEDREVTPGARDTREPAEDPGKAR